MPSVIDLYVHVMQSLSQMDEQSPLKNFLKQQTLSLMRGMHIADALKIKSMFILLQAATQLQGQAFVKDAPLLNKLADDIANDFSMNKLDDPNDQILIEKSKNYIQDLLEKPTDKTALKKTYNGKPWLLFDKKSTSHRLLIGLQKPETNLPGSGLIPTKNDKGWEFPPLESDIFIQQFQNDFASDTKKRALILGAGYGTFAYSLLEKSGQIKSKLVMNDLSEEHMAIFKDQLPKEFDGQVTIMAGNFLNEIDFAPNHFDQILLQNVMHFFTPEEVDNCLKRVYDWLKPGGRFTVTTCTPYQNELKDFVTIFEEKKTNGEAWPGFIENFKALFAKLNHPLTSSAPNGPFHFFDETTLKSNLSKHQFQISQLGYFAMPKTFPESLLGEGEEYVGAIAMKPKR